MNVANEQGLAEALGSWLNHVTECSRCWIASGAARSARPQLRELCPKGHGVAAKLLSKFAKTRTDPTAALADEKGGGA